MRRPEAPGLLDGLRILWPSFLMAGLAGTIFFALFDFAELSFLGEHVTATGTAVYSLGFLLFWLCGAASSWLTWYLQRPSHEVNRRSPRDGGGNAGGQEDDRAKGKSR